MSNIITCKICGFSSVNGIKSHIKKEHNLNSKEYKKLYPGSQVLSDKEINSIVSRNKSDKMRKFISDRNKDPDFQRKCKEGYTEESRKAQSDNMRRVSLRCWSDPEYAKRISDNASNTQIRLNKDPDVIKRKSDLFKLMWSNPEYAKKMYNSYRISPFGVSSVYKSKKFNLEIYCRSQGESEFLSLIESMSSVINLDLGYNYPIKYINNDDNSYHIYIPDFMIEINDGKKLIIEIKYETDNISNYKDKVSSALIYCKDNGYYYCYVKRFSGIQSIKEIGSFDNVIITKL